MGPGTYVRWTIASAWTAFEGACEYLTGASGLGSRFKDKLNKELDAGPWPVLAGHGSLAGRTRDLRPTKDTSTPPYPRITLSPVEEAELAIQVLRLAIKDMFARTGKPAEPWPDDDQDPVDPRKENVAALTMLRAGATPELGSGSAT